MNNENTDQVFNVGSDLPQTDPANDAFGYAPFARKIADVIQRTPTPQGLVMAIDGEWGAGKSSVLNFIKYYLNEASCNQKPIIVDFNPWWFRDSDDLAGQFLNIFSAQLAKESERFKKIRNLLSDYSDAIGQVAAIFDPSGKILTTLLGKLKGDKKSVPALKKELSRLLKDADQRILFVVDDIDRLSPNEIRELFKVIKALADFPNTIYLLSFDRKVVSASLNKSLSVDGESYLEKIIQLQLTLPTINKYKLRNYFIEELNKILSSKKSPEIDEHYWGTIYFEGLDYYIKKPRDVVRFINSFKMLYPSIVGEVNPVDFIALEFIRLFENHIYLLIRDNKEFFVGNETPNHRKQLETGFHEGWLSSISESKREHIKRLIQKIFPKFTKLTSSALDFTINSLGSISIGNSNRLYKEHSFDVYFQFAVPEDLLSQAEFRFFIESEKETMKTILLDSRSMFHRQGYAKTYAYLEEIRENTAISTNEAINIFQCLSEIGDFLVPDAENDFHYFPGMHIALLLQATRKTIDLLPRNEMQCLILNSIKKSNSLLLIGEIISGLIKNKDNSQDSPEFINTDDLISGYSDRLENMDDQELLEIPRFSRFLHRWKSICGIQDVSRRFTNLVQSEETLPVLLEKLITYSFVETYSDTAGRRAKPELDPRDYDDLIDRTLLESNINKLSKRTDITDQQRSAASLYLKAVELLSQGKSLELLDD